MQWLEIKFLIELFCGSSPNSSSHINRANSILWSWRYMLWWKELLKDLSRLTISIIYMRSCGSFEMIIKNALGNTYWSFRNKAAALFTLVKTVLIRISEDNFESERFLKNSIDVHVKFILYCQFICFP